MSQFNLLIRNAILDATGEPVQVVIKGQHIAAVQPEDLDSAATEIDGGGPHVAGHGRGPRLGGMPHGERNMKGAARHIELAFEIAQHYDVDVDIHREV